MQLWPRLSLLLRVEKKSISRLFQLRQPNDVFAAKLNSQLHTKASNNKRRYPQRPNDRRSSVTDIRLKYLPGCRNYPASSSSRRVWRSSSILSRGTSSRRQRGTSGDRGGIGRSGWSGGTPCTTRRPWTSWHSYYHDVGRCLGLWCWRASYCATWASPPLCLREKCSAPVLHQTGPRSNPAPQSTELNKLLQCTKHARELAGQSSSWRWRCSNLTGNNFYYTHY